MNGLHLLLRRLANLHAWQDVLQYLQWILAGTGRRVPRCAGLSWLHRMLAHSL